MKRIFLLIISNFFINLSFAQQRECVTVEMYNHQCELDSSIIGRRDSLEIEIQKYIVSNGISENDTLHTLPLIPGFIPTGDPYIDAINWQAAKKELYKTNPELYITLTRNVTATNQKK